VAFDNNTVRTTIGTATEAAKFVTAMVTLGILIKPFIAKCLKKVQFNQPEGKPSFLEREISVEVPTRTISKIEKGAYYFGFIAFFILGIKPITAAFVGLSTVVLLILFIGQKDRIVTRGEIAGLVFMGLLLLFVLLGSLISLMAGNMERIVGAN
jgi:hypothetical protein